MKARTGRIAPGEPIVFVATAAKHRRAAFEACDDLMNDLKSRAPFWKKAHGPAGARWVEPQPEDHAEAVGLRGRVGDRWAQEPTRSHFLTLSRSWEGLLFDSRGGVLSLLRRRGWSSRSARE